MMGSTRASALMEIMQIENKIKKVINSKRYKDIQFNIDKLKRRSGRAVFEVQNPNNSEKLVEVRRNSKESKEFLEIYETQLSEYETLINELGKKKKNLTTELFS